MMDIRRIQKTLGMNETEMKKFVDRLRWWKWRSKFIWLMRKRDPLSRLSKDEIIEMAESYIEDDFWSWRDTSPEAAVEEHISYINEHQ